jgi:hypothetical protein
MVGEEQGESKQDAYHKEELLVIKEPTLYEGDTPG